MSHQTRPDLTKCEGMTLIYRLTHVSCYHPLRLKQAASPFTTVNNMEESLKKPFLPSDKGSESLELDHELFLLKKGVRHTRWLKIILVILYFPTIALFALSYLQWSGSRHPRPREHYVYPDMILSELDNQTCK